MSGHGDEKTKKNLNLLNLFVIILLLFILIVPVVIKFLDTNIGKIIYGVMGFISIIIVIKIRNL